MPTVPSLYTGWSPPLEPGELLVPVELPPHPAVTARMRTSAARTVKATTRRLVLRELFMSPSSMRRLSPPVHFQSLDLCSHVYVLKLRRV